MADSLLVPVSMLTAPATVHAYPSGDDHGGVHAPDADPGARTAASAAGDSGHLNPFLAPHAAVVAHAGRSTFRWPTRVPRRRAGVLAIVAIVLVVVVTARVDGPAGAHRTFGPTHPQAGLGAGLPVAIDGAVRLVDAALEAG
ncbi:MAG: hypothetical protein ACLP8S_20675 [Solirubrobacteraceae bacterium]